MVGNLNPNQKSNMVSYITKYTKERRARDPEYKARTNRHVAKYMIKYKVWQRDNKIELFNSMGGKCKCCGITEWWNLTVDHIKPIHQPFIKRENTYKMVKRLLKNKGDRKDFQILCFGCNNSKNTNEKCGLDHSKP